MDAALYDPTAGFFTRGRGPADRGDFVTSPETGPLFGALVVPREVPAFYLPNGMALIVAALIAGICLLAAWIGIWKLRRVETAMVFR